MTVPSAPVRNTTPPDATLAARGRRSRSRPRCRRSAGGRGPPARPPRRRARARARRTVSRSSVASSSPSASVVGRWPCEPWAIAAGASAAIDSSKRTHGASPNSALTLPPVPISTTASVQPSAPSRAPIAWLQVVSPVAQTYRPSRSRTLAAAASTRSSAEARSSATAEIRTSTASTRAYVATIGLVGPQQVARRGARRPAIRRSRPAGTSGWPTGAPRPSACRRGTRLVGPHRAHLARRTGQRHDDPAVGPADEPAGRGPVRVGQR